jgi:hypothetical protein
MVCGLFGLSSAFLFLGPAPFIEAMLPALGDAPAQWALKTTSLLVFGVLQVAALVWQGLGCVCHSAMKVQLFFPA